MGEALIDLVPLQGGEPELRRAQPGGAPANVAVGLARLGTSCWFAGALGDDRFARALEERMTRAGVHLDLCARSPWPTALAVADPGEDRDHGGQAPAAAGADAAAGPGARAGSDREGPGHRRREGTSGGAADGCRPSGVSNGYRFHLHDTATFRIADRAASVARFGAVYVGGLAAVVPPAADAVAATARAAAAAPGTVLVVDPNVREEGADDPVEGLRRLRELCLLARIVKASDEDLVRLWPDRPVEETCRALAGEGRLVVLTRGARGSTAYLPGTGRPGAPEPVSVPAVPVDVVNTIGAGDAFTAGLLSRLDALGMLNPDALGELDARQARDLLRHAAAIAASVCATSGTEPAPVAVA
ncbi:PfkB family carbohydrate kinase [Streptomyces sp. SP18CS02]|nr:PfkB family carbohydrate kinase [Streptomyces sp. SP18CS02]MEE1754708.1 PfkB family carbohydrate kinase [Streptomyces sp. SP18CS02]